MLINNQNNKCFLGHNKNKIYLQLSLSQSSYNKHPILGCLITGNMQKQGSFENQTYMSLKKRQIVRFSTGPKLDHFI
jgi:hypothetical protein